MKRTNTIYFHRNICSDITTHRGHGTRYKLLYNNCAQIAVKHICIGQKHVYSVLCA